LFTLLLLPDCRAGAVGSVEQLWVTEGRAAQC